MQRSKAEVREYGEAAASVQGQKPRLDADADADVVPPTSIFIFRRWSTEWWNVLHLSISSVFAQWRPEPAPFAIL
jgi:hypothetical protein